MMKRYNFIAVLLIQAWLGYEFLISGWNKIKVNSAFTSGLAGYLKMTAGSRANAYGRFINHYILPHAITFGYLIEWAELLTGAVLILAVLTLFIPKKENSTGSKNNRRFVHFIAGRHFSDESQFLPDDRSDRCPARWQPLLTRSQFRFLYHVNVCSTHSVECSPFAIKKR